MDQEMPGIWAMLAVLTLKAVYNACSVSRSFSMDNAHVICLLSGQDASALILDESCLTLSRGAITNRPQLRRALACLRPSRC